MLAPARAAGYHCPQMRGWTSALNQPVQLSNCRFAVLSAQPPLQPSEILTYYERMRSYLEHEDDLINSRLTWSLTIHGFLFATFGILAGKSVDLLLELHKNSQLAASPQLQLAAVVLFVLECLVAVIGTMIGYSSREAIVAAHNALLHLAAIVHHGGALEIPAATIPSPPPGATLLPMIAGGGGHDRHVRGANSYYLSLPLLMMGVWLAIFIGLILFPIALHLLGSSPASPPVTGGHWNFLF